MILLQDIKKNSKNKEKNNYTKKNSSELLVNKYTKKINKNRRDKRKLEPLEEMIMKVEK